ncbi:hypothetical protein BAX97_11870 [Elizabethkingia meningoseptica]|uniref:hypothetical protein n=1 Tax=Elizabethkingia meningoseptica TaxID=238 RepID=UPI00099A1BEA|nr:hypothetical protein [Elizabethkingia meningoseptica]OPC31979.1 hypothetical protein BAX97_11870 [Elizabethkingia meningoseptica]
MNYLLFGGQPNSGKTGTIDRLTRTLLYSSFSFSIADGTFPPTRGNDFLILLERVSNGRTQYIIINSASDDIFTINNLKDFINKHSGKMIDIVISSVRDIGRERNDFFSTIGISPIDTNVYEIPLARVTRRNSSGSFVPAFIWYKNSLDRHINLVITNPPFSL